jgi:hypothetical protein
MEAIFYCMAQKEACRPRGSAQDYWDFYFDMMEIFK